MKLTAYFDKNPSDALKFEKPDLGKEVSREKPKVEKDGKFTVRTRKIEYEGGKEVYVDKRITQRPK